MARTSQIRARRRTPKTLDDYDDSSSTYWPPGWSFERWRDSQDELHALPESEQEKIREGFREGLGEDGFFELVDILYDWLETQQKEEDGGVVEPEQKAPADKPVWLKTYERYGGGEWGFVGFRTCLYDDEARWQNFKARLEQIARASFREEAAVEGVAEAAEKFTIRWEEDEGELKDASMETLQSKFEDLKPSLASAGMVSSLFLLATPDAVDSVLSSKTPFVRSQWAPNPPWVFVAPACVGGRASVEEETDDFALWKELFRVAAEVLVDGLWEAEDRDSSIYELTRGVAGYRWNGGQPALEEEDDGSGENAGRDGEGEALSLKRGGSDLDEGDDSADNVWWSWVPNPYRSDKRRRVQ